MNISIPNFLGSERSVELVFVAEILQKYCLNKKLLDVGGIPTSQEGGKILLDSIVTNKILYDIADFRGGKYKGDFVTIDIPELYDAILFLSSLEHFPQCTEGDMNFRLNEDRKGFEKALSILVDEGIIILTVPFGFPIWQPYHKNYDMKSILELSSGAKLLESYTYRLIGNDWILSNPDSMLDVYYTDRAYGVGCFVFRKLQ